MGNYFDEFKNSKTAHKLAEALKAYSGKPVTIMEVCGTHTMSIFRYGVRNFLPQAIKLVSGPGCPVCVTPVSFVDAAVRVAGMEDVITTTFGDLMKVPGTKSSLAAAKSDGADIRIVYSPLDSVEIAAENPGKQVVFLSVGFETTTPVSALALLTACDRKIGNFSMLAANKTMPEALKALSADSLANIGGYLYPGHVSAIIGTGLYDDIAGLFKIPGVVAGFEPLDIMHAILTLAKMINKGDTHVVNEYSRIVRKEGNPIALEKMYEVFEPCDSIWRGLGEIPGSGLKVRDKYELYDTWRIFGISPDKGVEPEGCLCGEVLKGRVTPDKCRLFGAGCTPENPTGACMVSSEGTCSAYYRYGCIK